MQKFLYSLLIALVGFSTAAFAAPNGQQIFLHVGKLTSNYQDKIKVEYVVCQSQSPTGHCQYSQVDKTVVDQGSDKSIPYDGLDVFIVSLQKPDGTVIWKAPADYGVNACTTEKGSNAMTFKSNFDGSITCSQGMDTRN